MQEHRAGQAKAFSEAGVDAVREEGVEGSVVCFFLQRWGESLGHLNYQAQEARGSLSIMGNSLIQPRIAEEPCPREDDLMKETSVYCIGSGEGLNVIWVKRPLPPGSSMALCPFCLARLKTLV